jgi:nitrile hydratase accessory protein
MVMERKEIVDQLCGGRSALPKNEDRLVFDEPWQGRAFGMALALAEHGAYEWEQFRKSLISSISAWEQQHAADDPDWNYYGQWLASLERLAIERGLITAAALDSRTKEFVERTRDEVI